MQCLHNHLTEKYLSLELHYFLICLQLQGMEEELRAAPSSYRNAMSTKLRMYRRDLGKLQRDMKNSPPGFSSSSQTVEGSHRAIYSSQNQQSVSVWLGTLMSFFSYVSSSFLSHDHVII